MPTPDYYIKNGHECQECIDMITADCSGGEAFIIGNIIKYLWRYKGKNGVRDLEKAKNYLDKLKNKNKTWYNSEPFIYNQDIYTTHNLKDFLEEIKNKIFTYCSEHDCTECKLRGTDFNTKFECTAKDVPICEYLDNGLIQEIMRIIDDAK